MSADQILSRLEQIVSRLEAVEAKIGGGAGGAAAPAAAGEQGAAAKAWDDLIASYFAPFAATTEKIGGDNVKAQVALIATGNGEISKLINVASQSKQPAVADLQKIIAPIAASIKGVKELRESNRRDKQWEHLSTLSEAIAYMNWVVVTPTPAPFVKESLDASLFWSNKILKMFKGKEEDHVAWCNQLKEFLNEMGKYIKQFHTTGLTWNPKGGDAVAAAGSAAPAAPAAPAAEAPKEKKVYTPEEVAKHNKEDDCWVIVNGEVLDVTGFLNDHPGGKKPIMLFAGRDASVEFNLLHKPDVVDKYAPEVIIGTISTGKAKL
jgi:adenylyl cyclase-associated protein